MILGILSLIGVWLIYFICIKFVDFGDKIMMNEPLMFSIVFVIMFVLSSGLIKFGEFMTSIGYGIWL